MDIRKHSNSEETMKTPFSIPWPYRLQSATCVVLGALTLAGGIEAAIPVDRVVFPDDPSVLDVKRDSGAKGDGVADDTAPLQAAIEAARIAAKAAAPRCFTCPTAPTRLQQLGGPSEGWPVGLWRIARRRRDPVG